MKCFMIIHNHTQKIIWMCILFHSVLVMSMWLRAISEEAYLIAIRIPHMVKISPHLYSCFIYGTAFEPAVHTSTTITDYFLRCAPSYQQASNYPRHSLAQWPMQAKSIGRAPFVPGVILSFHSGPPSQNRPPPPIARTTYHDTIRRGNAFAVCRIKTHSVSGCWLGLRDGNVDGTQKRKHTYIQHRFAVKYMENLLAGHI